MLNSISVRCFAKINLYLEVLGARPDGFHEINTLFQSIDLHDTLHIEFQDVGIDLLCEGAELPTGRANLVVRAAESFLETVGRELGVRIRLEKHIPVAAGLGGGSSDAAATLRALNLMMGEPLGQQEMMRTATNLGSDVPYFLVGGTVAGSGRGHVLTALQDLPPIYMVLVTPELKISAAEAYRLFDLTSGAAISDSTERSNDGSIILPDAPWYNDLEAGVFAAHPELHPLKQRLLDSGALDAVMSGSGAVIAGRFLDRELADKAAKLFRARGVGAIVCVSLTGKEYQERFVIEEPVET